MVGRKIVVILLLFIYAVGCIALVASIKKSQKRMITRAVWFLSVSGSYLGWLLIDMFDESLGGFQFERSWSWVPAWGVNLSFAIDGYSVWLLLLTLIVTAMAAIVSLEWVNKGLKEHLILLYSTQFLLLICFSTLDAFVFLLAFESMLLPFYLWIVVWGSEARGEAGMVFLLYTLASSILMTLAFATLGGVLGGFSWRLWVASPLSIEAQTLYFWAVSLALMVKLPLFPFHTWLPLAHTQAPSSASMVLASVMLKIAGYGWLRWVLPIAPDAARKYALCMVVLGLVSVVWLPFATMVQKDMKRMIAYASVNHMGWVVLGLFTSYLPHPVLSMLLIDGVSVQMFSHGLVSSGLFMAFGMIYHRLHRREIQLLSGLSNTMPVLSGWFIFLCLANIGIPGSLNFVGEWMILLGAMAIQPAIALIACLGILGSTAYSLWMYREVFSGSARIGQKISDITMLESFLLAILVGFILIFGFFPRPVLEGIHATSVEMRQHLFTSKLGH